MTEAQLRDIARYEESDQFTELQKAAIAYAEALTRTPADVSDELFERLRRHLDDGQLVELTTAIAWENFRARFNRGFDVKAQGLAEGAYCPLPERPNA